MPINLGSAEGYIDLDFSNLKKGVQSTISTLDKLDSVYTESESFLRKMEAELKNAGGVFQAAAQKSKQLSTELNAAQKKTEVYRKAIDGMNSIIRNASQAQTALQPEIQKTTEKLKAAEQKVKELSAAYKTAAKATKDAAKAHGEQSEEAQKAAEAEAAAKEELDKASKSADQYRNSLLQMQTQHAKLGQEIEGAKDKTSEFRTALNNTEAKIANLRQELYETQSILVTFGTAAQNAGDKWQAAGSKINNVGNILTLGVTTPIIGIGTAAVKAGNDFEAQMSRVSAIAGAYGNDLEKLRQQAIDLGADTSFSATSAAEAMENLASAGFDTQEIMEAMPGMLNLAASSGEDLASSADIAASTLRGFQLEASDAGHVADVLAKNAADTNAAIIDTGYAMKYVAPVAQSAGWSLEEVAAAIGVLADAGIKGEQAGTTLRGALTRLMKPTDKMQEAMDDLGITFYDAEGKMKPLSTIVDELQKSTEGLTDEQRDNRLATIFGTEALSGMKVLLASSKEKLDSLTEGLKNADGASQKMADTMMDNTKGSVEAMNGSLETAAITIQKQLAPWITKGAKQVTEWANGFAELDENTQGTILSLAGVAAAAGPVTKGIGSVTGGIGKLVKGTGGLIKDIGKLSSAKKAAQAIGEIGTFSTKSVSGVSGLSKALFNLKSPAGLAVGAATLLTGAIVGIGAAVKKAHDDMVKADIAERFGDIELSAEEVEDVAKRLTQQDWMVTLDATIEAKNKLTEFEKNLKETMAEINKTEWKIDVGLELTDEEKTAYKNSLTDFVDQAIGYVEQQQYTATLAIDTILTPGSAENDNVKNMADSFYSDMNKTLTGLGTELADIVNNAYADNLLSKKEMDRISEKYQEIQKELDKIRSAEYNVKLEQITADIPKGGLTPDSFSELSVEMNEQISQRKEEIEQNKINALIPIRAQLDAGEIPQEEYDRVKQQYEESAKEKIGDVNLDAIHFEIGTVTTNYKEELDKVKDVYTTDTSKWVNDILEETGTSFYAALNQVEDGIITAPPRIGASLSESAKETMHRALEDMKPQKEDLEATIQACQEAGYAVPENIRKGLMDIHRMEALLGETDGLFAELAKGIVDSPEKFNAIKTAKQNGMQIPEELIKSLELYSGEVYDAASDTWKQVPTASEETIEATKSELSEHGVEASQALIDSLAIQAPNTRAKAIELLEQLKDAEADQRPLIVGQLFDLGIAVDDSLGAGIVDNLGLVDSETQGMIDVIDTTTQKTIATITPEFAERLRQMGITGFDAMDTEMTKSDLSAPGIEELSPEDANEWGKKTHTKLQNAINHVAVGVDAVIKIANAALPGHADGGIFYTPHVAAFAEDGPEAVVPLSAARRTQGIEIWREAGQLLGASNQIRGNMSYSSSDMGIDYHLLAKTIASEMRKAPLEVNSNIALDNHLQIDLDSEIIGRKTAPTVSRILSKK